MADIFLSATAAPSTSSVQSPVALVEFRLSGVGAVAASFTLYAGLDGADAPIHTATLKGNGLVAEVFEVPLPESIAYRVSLDSIAGSAASAMVLRQSI